MPPSSRAVGKAGSASPGILQGSGEAPGVAAVLEKVLPLSFLPWSEIEKGKGDIKGK